MSEYIVGITRENIEAVVGHDDMSDERIERIEDYLRGVWPYLIEQSVGDIIKTAASETEESWRR